MKLKTVEIEGTTYAEVKDGKPVFVEDDGSENAIDVPQSVQTIARLNREAQGHREAKEAAEAQLKQFEGIDDPGAARKALDTVKSLKDKELIDAGEVEKVKAEAIKAVEEKYKPVLEERDGLKSTLEKEMIGGRFARSKFAADKLAIPTDLVQSAFGDRFKIEDGKVVAYGPDGNKVFSKERPGEPADFDEALELLVNQYPNKDQILKGSGHQGGGARPPNGKAGAKTMTRSEYDQMAPLERQKLLSDGYTLTE